jgi:hypothetical protein
MYELELTKTLGRTGNSLICIINAIFFALSNKISKVKFYKLCWWTDQLLPGKSNELINTLEININKEDFLYTEILDTSDEKKQILKNRCSLIWNEKEQQFESWFCGFYLPTTPFDKRMYIARKYIRPILNINEKELHEDDLVIHLRSGDIMNKGHPCYIQPPLSFYDEVINLRKWKNIYIITEHNNNPCLTSLKNKYTNVISFINTKNRHGGNANGFAHDLGYLIGCHNYVACQSSLCPIVIQLSKTIKNVYLPSYFLVTQGNHAIREGAIWWSDDLKDKKTDFKINDVEFHVLNYDKYIDTKEPIYNYQETKYKEYMLNYKKD